MIVNIIVHIIIGILAPSVFIWSTSGLVTAGIIASITQAIHSVRMYYYHKNRILAAPDDVRETQMHNFQNRAFPIMAQLYVVKVVFYGVVILVGAQLARAYVA